MATTRKTPTSKTAANVTVARKAAARGLESVQDRFTQLEQVKKDLEAVSEKLNGIDRETLSQAKREEWSNELDRVDLAIARARSALQRNLLDAFEGELDDIATATAALAARLERLNKVAQIIDTVAGVLGVIERVITLGR